MKNILILFLKSDGNKRL